MATTDFSPTSDAFQTLEELLAENDRLLAATSEEALSPEDTERIQTFLRRAAATGIILDYPNDRRQVQGLLDYWSATLYTHVGHEAIGESQSSAIASRTSGAVLSPFDHSVVEDIIRKADAYVSNMSREQRNIARRLLLRLSELDEPTSSFRVRTVRVTTLQSMGVRPIVDDIIEKFIAIGLLRPISEEDQEARIMIAHEPVLRKWSWLRSALERRLQFREAAQFWQSQKRNSGALIDGGPLLDEAQDYRDLGELEQEFADAGRQLQDSKAKRTLRLWKLAASVLIGVASLLIILLCTAIYFYNVAEKARADAVEAGNKARDASRRAMEAAESARFESLQAKLADRARSQAIYNWKSKPSTEEREQSQQEVVNWLKTNRVPYDPNFVVKYVPLPKLSPELREISFQDGEPLEYFHYSLVLHKIRRIAIYAASNFNRRDVKESDPSSANFILDPRVPPEYQLGDDLYDKQDRFYQGNLISRNDVMWGSLPQPGKIRGDGFDFAVNFYTNIAPQRRLFTYQIWAPVEAWTRDHHNPKADRVSFFCGPVLRDSDVIYRNAQVPRSFWRIAVSRDSSDSNSLVVDAFLVDQYDEDNKPRAYSIDRERFDPAPFRVKIVEIERLTGLDFGALRKHDRPLPTAASPNSSPLPLKSIVPSRTQS